MLPIVQSANAPTTARVVAEFERALELTLPTRYKEFLLAANGGVPENPLFPIEGMPLNPDGVVQVFFGLEARLPTSDLVQVYDMYVGGFPAGIVPIGCTGMDDFICLDLRNGGERVAFWDKRHFWGTGEWRESDLYHVADTFDQFLASLRPNPY